jgi:hypothetical protein
MDFDNASVQDCIRSISEDPIYSVLLKLGTISGLDG